jgi:hypothetical protein
MNRKCVIFLAFLVALICGAGVLAFTTDRNTPQSCADAALRLVRSGEKPEGIIPECKGLSQKELDEAMGIAFESFWNNR